MGQIGFGMLGSVGYPQRLLRGFGVVETVNHFGGHEGVGIAVDEQHGVCGPAHGIDG